MQIMGGRLIRKKWARQSKSNPFCPRSAKTTFRKDGTLRKHRGHDRRTLNEEEKRRSLRLHGSWNEAGRTRIGEGGGSWGTPHKIRIMSCFQGATREGGVPLTASREEGRVPSVVLKPKRRPAGTLVKVHRESRWWSLDSEGESNERDITLEGRDGGELFDSNRGGQKSPISYKRGWGALRDGEVISPRLRWEVLTFISLEEKRMACGYQGG